MKVIKLVLAQLRVIKNVDEINENKRGWYECPVCGMDEWCGTDGCPMDPQ